MRHETIPSTLFIENRARLKSRLPAGSLAVVNANDIPPTNADGSRIPIPNSDLFYLTGIEQEETILVLAPDALDPKLREVLFVREPNAHLKTWEGHKHPKDEAQALSGPSGLRPSSHCELSSGRGCTTSRWGRGRRPNRPAGGHSRNIL